MAQPLNQTFSFRKPYFHEQQLSGRLDRTFYCRLWSLFSSFPLVLKKPFSRVGQSEFQTAFGMRPRMIKLLFFPRLIFPLFTKKKSCFLLVIDFMLLRSSQQGILILIRNQKYYFYTNFLFWVRTFHITINLQSFQFILVKYDVDNILLPKVFL